MMPMGKDDKNNLAVIIARGIGGGKGMGSYDNKEGSEDYSTDEKKEHQLMAMDKFIEAVKEGNTKRANLALEAWCDVYKAGDDSYSSHNSKNSKNSNSMDY